MNAQTRARLERRRDRIEAELREIDTALLVDRDPPTDDDALRLPIGALGGDDPRARSTDPETSHKAAMVVDLTRRQRAVLDAIQSSRSGLSDVALIETYRRWEGLRGWPKQSDSGIRSRRAELVRKDRVVDSGKTTTLPTGRQAIVWQATIPEPTGDARAASDNDQSSDGGTT